MLTGTIHDDGDHDDDHDDHDYNDDDFGHDVCDDDIEKWWLFWRTMLLFYQNDDDDDNDQCENNDIMKMTTICPFQRNWEYRTYHHEPKRRTVSGHLFIYLHFPKTIVCLK